MNLTIQLLQPVLSLVIGFLSGYFMASWIESYMHQHVSDAPPRVVKGWKKHPRLFQYLIRTNYSHHVIHHIRTYKNNHVTQFSSETERRELDQVLNGMGSHGRIIIDSRYAVKLHGSGALVFIAPLIPVIPISYFLIGPMATVGCCLALALPPLFSNFLHPYLHMPYVDTIQSSPWWLKPVIKTGYFRAMCLNHFLHHRYMASNFNLVLGADWIRGVARRPTNLDLELMKNLGLPIPQNFGGQS